MAVVQHRTQAGANLHNSKATAFTGSPSAFTPTETGVFYVKTDVTPNRLYRSTGTTAGALAEIGSAGVTGSGTVTSVALSAPSFLSVSGSPVTTAGTLTLTLASQPANHVLAGATSGGSATPSFRALVAADIPAIAISGVTGLQSALDGKANVGSAGTGTVTSVALSAPSIFTVSGSPVTGVGTLTIAVATQPANRVWASPVSGLDAAPTFRALVAADIPAIAQSQVTNLTNDLALRPTSNTTGITGATQITNIVTLSQANYDALSPKSSTTLYVII